MLLTPFAYVQKSRFVFQLFNLQNTRKIPAPSPNVRRTKIHLQQHYKNSFLPLLDLFGAKTAMYTLQICFTALVLISNVSINFLCTQKYLFVVAFSLTPRKTLEPTTSVRLSKPPNATTTTSKFWNAPISIPKPVTPPHQAQKPAPARKST